MRVAKPQSHEAANENPCRLRRQVPLEEVSCDEDEPHLYQRLKKQAWETWSLW